MIEIDRELDRKKAREREREEREREEREREVKSLNTFFKPTKKSLTEKEGERERGRE